MKRWWVPDELEDKSLLGAGHLNSLNELRKEARAEGALKAKALRRAARGIPYIDLGSMVGEVGSDGHPNLTPLQVGEVGSDGSMVGEVASGYSVGMRTDDDDSYIFVHEPWSSQVDDF